MIDLPSRVVAGVKIYRYVLEFTAGDDGAVKYQTQIGGVWRTMTLRATMTLIRDHLSEIRARQYAGVE